MMKFASHDDSGSNALMGFDFCLPNLLYYNIQLTSNSKLKIQNRPTPSRPKKKIVIFKFLNVCMI